jgi:hypothetical protein
MGIAFPELTVLTYQSVADLPEAATSYLLKAATSHLLFHTTTLRAIAAGSLLVSLAH